MNYRIYPPDGLLEARIEMPLSKSVSNRALIINALNSKGRNIDLELAHCSDTDAMLAALQTDGGSINVGGAGTAMRFLTAYFAAQPGKQATLDGDDRMRCRPIAPLVDALRSLGADIEYVGNEGFPPLKIVGRQLSGGSLDIDASISSQFISALLMVAPTFSSALHLTLKGQPTSVPYTDLTLHLMRQAGADAERQHDRIDVAPKPYSNPLSEAEGDWSAASYWFEIEALTSGFITLDRLAADSRQPDKMVAQIFQDLGVDTQWEGEEGGIDLAGSPDVSPRLILDMADTPDLVQTVAVSCAMLGIPFRLSGLHTLRIKETDRIAALTTELAKVGVNVAVDAKDTMEWDGRRHPILTMPEFDTYADHRMAMAFAPVACYIPGIVVRDVEVVEKSYPDYWTHLQQAGFTLVDAALPVAAEEGAEES